MAQERLLIRPTETETETASETPPQPIPAGAAFALVAVAEDARFELARGCPQHAFQACALGQLGESSAADSSCPAAISAHSSATTVVGDPSVSYTHLTLPT